MFGKAGVSGPRFHLMKNALNLEDYAYDASTRDDARCELGVPAESFVVGHVGRFSQQKNHLFLVDKGETRAAVERRIAELGLADRVVFAGVRSDACRLYSAMDVFVFPSVYEGLPNVVVEAQANGLPCVISDSITREVGICENVVYKRLGDGLDEWADAALSAERIESSASAKDLKGSGYEINSELPGFVRLVFG